MKKRGIFIIICLFFAAESALSVSAVSETKTKNHFAAESSTLQYQTRIDGLSINEDTPAHQSAVLALSVTSTVTKTENGAYRYKYEWRDNAACKRSAHFRAQLVLDFLTSIIGSFSSDSEFLKPFALSCTPRHYVIVRNNPPREEEQELEIMNKNGEHLTTINVTVLGPYEDEEPLPGNI